MSDSTPSRLPFGHGKSGSAQPKPQFEVVEEEANFEVVEEAPKKALRAAPEPDEEPKPQKPRKKKKKKGTSLAEKLGTQDEEDQKRRDESLRDFEWTWPSVLFGIGFILSVVGAFGASKGVSGIFTLGALTLFVLIYIPLAIGVLMVIGTFLGINYGRFGLELRRDNPFLADNHRDDTTYHNPPSPFPESPSSPSDCSASSPAREPHHASRPHSHVRGPRRPIPRLVPHDARRTPPRYDHHCFLPLYVTCGSRLLVAYLRPSNIGADHHARAIIKLLVTRLRQAWPAVKIPIRGDGGFGRWRLMTVDCHRMSKTRPRRVTVDCHSRTKSRRRMDQERLPLRGSEGTLTPTLQMLNQPPQRIAVRAVENPTGIAVRKVAAPIRQVPAHVSYQVFVRCRRLVY